MREPCGETASGQISNRGVLERSGGSVQRWESLTPMHRLLSRLMLARKGGSIRN